MLSNSCKYAIRSILYLAINGNEDNKISSKVVADEINVPAAFLAKIFQTLSREKFICSSKGPNGGFYVTKRELKIKLYDIVLCIDGNKSIENCYLGLPSCSDNKPCCFHSSMKVSKSIFVNEVLEKTIDDYAQDIKEGKSFI